MNMQKEDDYHIEPGQECEIDLFRPDDAEGVVNLFISVYGKEYPIKTYIDRERLIAENAAGNTISTVARTEKGDIVGHTALFQSAPCKKIYESGAGLVHRHYRGGKGIFTELARYNQDTAAKKFGVEGIFGEPVCNHIFSQKMTFNLGWKTTALEVDLMPASAYNLEKSAGGRVSSFLDFVTITPAPHRVYMPCEYKNELLYIYQGMDDKRELLVSEESFPGEGASIIDTQIFDFAQVARIAIGETGHDFLMAFSKEEEIADSRGVTLFEAWINVSQPWAGEAVRLLRQRGYFFGGVLPRWFDQDGLLMIRAKHRPDWEGMQIYSERAKRIAGLVRKDWKNSISGNL